VEEDTGAQEKRGRCMGGRRGDGKGTGCMGGREEEAGRGQGVWEAEKRR